MRTMLFVLIVCSFSLGIVFSFSPSAHKALLQKSFNLNYINGNPKCTDALSAPLSSGSETPITRKMLFRPPVARRFTGLNPIAHPTSSLPISSMPLLKPALHSSSTSSRSSLITSTSSDAPVVRLPSGDLLPPPAFLSDLASETIVPYDDSASVVYTDQNQLELDANVADQPASVIDGDGISLNRKTNPTRRGRKKKQPPKKKKPSAPPVLLMDLTSDPIVPNDDSANVVCTDQKQLDANAVDQPASVSVGNDSSHNREITTTRRGRKKKQSPEKKPSAVDCDSLNRHHIQNTCSVS